jgi:transcription factor SPN1
MERERMLARVMPGNRARLDATSDSYTIAPRSTFDPNKLEPNYKPIGAAGDSAFNKLTRKLAMKKKG